MIGFSQKTCLYTPTFDFVFIVGVFALTVLLGGIALASVSAAICVAYFNFWLLAPAHVVSTFTRIAFDRTQIKRHWFLLFALPLLVLISTASLTWFGGIVTLNTLYFTWQAWHYTRQSHGIARAYRRTSLLEARGHDRLTECVIFGFSSWGLLHRAAQQPVEFFQSPIWCFDIPDKWLMSVGCVSMTALVLWLWRQLNVSKGAVPSTNYTLFVLSHVSMTMISYFMIDDITYGWLFINLWHNAQYLLFVWVYNRKRYSHGIEAKHYVISWLCQPKHIYYYALTCTVLGIILYSMLGIASKLAAWHVLPFTLVLYQTVAFHHYLVDAVIWRTSVKAEKMPVTSYDMMATP